MNENGGWKIDEDILDVVEAEAVRLGLIVEDYSPEEGVHRGVMETVETVVATVQTIVSYAETGAFIYLVTKKGGQTVGRRIAGDGAKLKDIQFYADKLRGGHIIQCDQEGVYRRSRAKELTYGAMKLQDAVDPSRIELAFFEVDSTATCERLADRVESAWENHRSMEELAARLGEEFPAATVRLIG